MKPNQAIAVAYLDDLEVHYRDGATIRRQTIQRGDEGLPDEPQLGMPRRQMCRVAAQLELRAVIRLQDLARLLPIAR